MKILKAEDNPYNTFLSDDDKLPDQVIVSITVDGLEFSGMGQNRGSAIEDLRDRVKDHFAARWHAANKEINALYLVPAEWIK